MAGTSELVQGWLQSGGTASSPEQATGQEPISPAGSLDSDETVVRAENSTSDSSLEGREDAPTDSSNSTDKPASLKGPSEKTSGTKEVITITDEKGKRKVEVDFNDKESLKKYVQMAHGARKWQAERDQAIEKAKANTEKLTQLESNWKALEDAYSNGVEGLVDLLEGKRGAYKEWRQREIDRHEFLRKASPEQIELFETKERLQRMEQSDSRRQKEYEDRLKRIDSERDQTDLKNLESKVHPAFTKYRFAHKLGDANDEQMFDEMLWNTALKRLEPYEEQGVDLSPELLEREFRNVAQSLRKRISGLADKKASRSIEQKKQEATENVQAKVMSGYKSGGTAREAADLLNQGAGGINQLLKNWGKFGSVFK